MARYAFRFVDRWGRTVRRLDVECLSDARALRLARNLRAAHRIDIFAGDHLVGRIAAPRTGTTGRPLAGSAAPVVAGRRLGTLAERFLRLFE